MFLLCENRPLSLSAYIDRYFEALFTKQSYILIFRKTRMCINETKNFNWMKFFQAAYDDDFADLH
jgi:hypothetical protein